MAVTVTYDNKVDLITKRLAYMYEISVHYYIKAAGESAR
jgi:hypothetical protein